jgi:hypothetical protein
MTKRKLGLAVVAGALIANEGPLIRSSASPRLEGINDFIMMSLAGEALLKQAISPDQ